MHQKYVALHTIIFDLHIRETILLISPWCLDVCVCAYVCVVDCKVLVVKSDSSLIYTPTQNLGKSATLTVLINDLTWSSSTLITKSSQLALLLMLVSILCWVATQACNSESVLEVAFYELFFLDLGNDFITTCTFLHHLQGSTNAASVLGMCVCVFSFLIKHYIWCAAFKKRSCLYFGHSLFPTPFVCSYFDEFVLEYSHKKTGQGQTVIQRFPVMISRAKITQYSRRFIIRTSQDHVLTMKLSYRDKWLI